MTSTAKPSSRVGELDTVRGIAFICVIVGHEIVLQLPFSPSRWFLVGDVDILGVDIFLVLSGYLVGGILLDNRASGNYFKAFYLRRICRTFPPYYVLLLSYMILRHTPWGPPLQLEQTAPPWVYFVHGQNFWYAWHGSFGSQYISITWTLAVEEQFYLLLPMLIRFCPLAQLPKVLMFLIGLAPVLRYLMFPWLPLGAVVLLPCRMDALLAGVLMSYAVRTPTCMQWLRDHMNWLYVALVLLLLGSPALAYACLGFLEQIDTRTLFAFQVTNFPLHVLIAVCLILIGQFTPHAHIKRLYGIRLLQQAGIICYAIYLFEIPIRETCQLFFLHTVRSWEVRSWDMTPTLLDPQSIPVNLFAMALLVVVCSLSWRFFELPIIKLGHGVRYLPPSGEKEAAS